MTPIFDRRAVRLHRDRAAGSVHAVQDVLMDAAERLLDRLDDTTVRFTQALDVGGRGVVAPMLRGRGIGVVSCDLSARMAGLNGGLAVAADEERLPFAAGSFDLVVACLSLHWVNDLPGALIQLRMALRPGGLLLASFPVLGTLGGLRAALTEAEAASTGGAAPRVSPFPELRDLAALMQRAGFALPVVDVEEMRLSYADPLLLLRDLRAAGETNAVALRDRGFPGGRCSRRGWRDWVVDWGMGTGGGVASGRDGDGVGAGAFRRILTRLVSHAPGAGWAEKHEHDYDPHGVERGCWRAGVPGDCCDSVPGFDELG